MPVLRRNARPRPAPSEEAARTAVQPTPPSSIAGIAMVLSFLWPGLGQIYRGRLIRGLVWMVAVAIGYVCFIVPGMVLHLLCIIFAGKRE